MGKKPLMRQDSGNNREIIWNTDSELHLFILCSFLFFFPFNSTILRHETNAIIASGINDLKILQITLNASDTA